MVGKQKSFAEGRRMRTAASVDFQASDTAKFWMLHTLNSYIPAVSHMVDHGNAHPEDCYVLIASLIGELCTFTADGDPTSRCRSSITSSSKSVFDPLFDRALTLISAVLAENYTVVPLEKRDDGMYLGKFEDPKLPRTHELFLEAKGADEATLRERMPRLSRSGRGRRSGTSSTPPCLACVWRWSIGRRGLSRSNLGRLPANRSSGDYWNDILGSGTVAIYQPIDPKK
jgi:type VI secretion system protein ImpJ